jgi:dihydroflavonol-4-reductase
VRPTLVTGATGFLGWHVANRLLARGEKVRALVRDTSRVRELDGEVVVGDLRDPESLERAVAGCAVVYHVAADYRLWAKDPSELYRSNVEGTRNLLTAARDAGVERVVYTSTVGCIGMPEDGPGDEDTQVDLEQMAGAYKRSKFQAEQVAMEFARAGLPVVIVNPTAPIGDHDFKPTPTGKIVVDYLEGRFAGLRRHGFEPGGCGRHRRGPSAGLRARRERGALHPGLREPDAAADPHASGGYQRWKSSALAHPVRGGVRRGLASTGWANLTGHEPRAPIDAVKMARKKMFVSLDKAKRELGIQSAAGGWRVETRGGLVPSNGYV